MFAQEVFEHAGHGGCGGRRFAWIRGGGFEMPGGFGGPRAGFGRGFGHGRERLFDAGDIKLVILKLLSEQPSYGYQLIKTMEERLGGGYTPSAGIVYPTLTMLKKKASLHRPAPTARKSTASRPKVSNTSRPTQRASISSLSGSKKPVADSVAGVHPRS